MDCAQISAQSSNLDSVCQIRLELCSLNDCGFVYRTVTTELMALDGARSLLSLFMLIVFSPTAGDACVLTLELELVP